MMYIGNMRLMDIGTKLLLSGFTFYLCFTKKHGHKDSCFFLSGKLCSTYFRRQNIAIALQFKYLWKKCCIYMPYYNQILYFCIKL